ncbi:hypothetical protein ONS95_000501 [Cadophora gregata]|uniref:uncharacterized protein n=1 Tax=Cadophora gregata TaxID=51156 RepID=UPI0026DD4CEB|nr:uncharacterized protein ONS95_000501 [Cadophora gregata]KAK0125492.1 hypothetical protein ONS96_009329 [Cadophora gregata f. sp. sojae]KAK0128534.1 hypothetical protein ONS95_000501 [Cadophora gregata]
MAQGGRPKPALDVLQSMINAVLIETGKALRPSNKDSGRTPTTVNTRLRTIIPSAVENFHTALDDLECDILRAKSVLLRDLDELRAKRIALENPVPILEEAVEKKAVETNTSNEDSKTVLGDELYTSPLTTIKEEKGTSSPEKQTSNEPPQPSRPEPSKETATQSPEDTKVPPQGPTPPASTNDTSQDTKPIGLGINTEGTPAADGGDAQNSAIDSLFDMPDDNENGDSALNFDDMDFSLDTTTQIEDTSQTQNNDFDLSNFGNSNPGQSDTNTNANADQSQNQNQSTGDQNKLGDDLFAMVGGGDGMDLDLDMGMAGAEDSVFDDMFFGGGDDEGMSGGGELQHGEFDNAFFGLEEN